jgi:hypothetical protein
MSSLLDLLYEHACVSYEKQEALERLIGDRPWTFELAKGSLSFGPDLSFAVQVLGTESAKRRTWLWSWANQISPVPEKLLDSALRLRELGRREAIPQLTTPEVPLSEIDGHHLSLVASGLLSASAYYRGPYEGGAVFLLIQDPRIARQRPTKVKEMERFFGYFCSRVGLKNDEPAYIAYLRNLGWECKVQAGETRGSTKPTW